ncbi:hypothetical protein Aple_020820 [Acrocarpospora pleiomorpha]|uniref:Uncharacterized protein n=1 Tax=Acrocarpospora pleiomorpha TaxID=90975 RepID=A0A5M3XEW9_9ACTN|nr:hypothetical protein [Acrocarpospora pleiomorpha]GES19186.1 hypothetical protein Aple_020820 [Acrocarpospora pleiomorpha]
MGEWAIACLADGYICGRGWARGQDEHRGEPLGNRIACWRGFLTGSPNWFGRPRIERLAALTGRSPEILQRALTDASPHKPRKRHAAPKPKRMNKAELYQRIRHDAETEPLSMRALVKKHRVTWRTVRAALDNPEPRPRKPLPRRPSMIDPVQHLIDSMIEAGHGPKQIWERLTDEHDAAISYGAAQILRSRPDST